MICNDKATLSCRRYLPGFYSKEDHEKREARLRWGGGRTNPKRVVKFKVIKRDRIMGRQESCPRSAVQPAPLMEQIVSSLSIPGDRPVRPLARGPGRSGNINTSAAFVLVLTPCFTAQAQATGHQPSAQQNTPLSTVNKDGNRDVTVPRQRRLSFCLCSHERS